MQLSWQDQKCALICVIILALGTGLWFAPKADTISLKSYHLPINQATTGQLQSLPHVGPNRAIEIFEYRKKFGHLESADDLASIAGIGKKLAREIAKYVEFSK